jgi:PAS domain S-box-containing protein
MTKHIRMLILGDSDEGASSLAAIVESAGYEVIRRRLDPAGGLPENVELQDWDVLLAACEPRARALQEVFGRRRSGSGFLPVILVGNEAGSEGARLAADTGASAFVPHGEGDLLVHTIEKELDAADESERNRQVDVELEEHRAYLEHIVAIRTADLEAVNERLIREIQVHRMTAEALRESERRFRTMAENASQLIMRFGRTLKCLYVSPMVTDLTGLPVSAFLGKTLGEAGLPRPVTEVLARALEEVFQSGKSVTVIFEFPDLEGPRHLETVFTPEFSGRGEVVSVLTMTRDQTDVKRAEDVLKRDGEALRKLVDEKSDALVAARLALAESERLRQVGRLAATVAHELRNPLGVIGAAVYNVRRKRSNEAIDPHLDTIEDKIRESSIIIDDLLNYSRMSEPRREPVEVNKLIVSAVEAASEQFGRAGEIVETDIEALVGLKAEIDAGQISHVLANLLTNAFQALPGGNGSIVVRGRLADGGSAVVIEVEDDGVGMTAEEVEEAFEPFYTSKSRGTGLGLTICKDIVNRHGGAIAIRGEKGSGTRVTVLLPIRS